MPSTPDAAKQKALALEQQGKLAEADAAWQQVLNAHPGNPEPLAHLGLLAAREEHFKEAIAYDRKALAINPRVPGVRLNLALALFKSSQFASAIPEFEILRKDAPANSPDAQRCTILIGMSYYGLADYAKAAPYLKEAAVQNPNSLPLLLALAHSYLWTGQLQSVLDVYHQILVLDPNSAEADMLAGEALDGMKDNEGSTKMFRAAVQADPKQPNVHFGLGYLLWTQKQYPEAAKEFQAELANDPDHTQSMLYLADSEIQMNHPEGIEALLRKVIRLNPSYGLAHLDLGVILSDAGSNVEALHELTEAEKLNPNDVNVHWRLGRLYRAMGRKELSMDEFGKAGKLNKKADDDLFKRIANGNAHPPQGQSASPSPEQK
ncbi:MAG TPA: tetratricopeptide repeat protein [Terracidiphilus sp.]|nr:tetratricopeptide repeat protein [Terracidiphilus sp.]